MNQMPSAARNSLSKLLFALIATFALSHVAHGQYIITSVHLGTNQLYEDFNSFRGSAATLPANGNWQLSSSNSLTYRGVNNGSDSAGGVWAFGVNNTDRSLGFLGSGAAGVNMNAITQFRNESGSTITSFVLSYLGEEWRRASGSTSLITVSYSTTFAGTYTSLGSSTWQPTNGADASGSLISSSTITASNTAVSIANGTSFFLRFEYQGAASPREGLSLDNLTVNFGAGAPPVTSLAWVGGTGTWNATNTNWGSPAQTWNASLTGIFEGTAGTVTIDTGGISANAGLIFGTTGYAIAGAALTLGGGNATANTLTTNASVTANISSSIAGSAGFTKAGAGTLILSASNSIAGDAVISGGNLTLAAAGALGSVGNVTVATGTTLFLTGAAGDRINNSAAVSVAGTFDLNGLSETIGALSLTAGTVTTGAGNLTLGGNVTVNTAATSTITGNLDLGGVNLVFTVADGSSATDLSLTGTLISNGSITYNGSVSGARIDLAGANTYGGGTTLNNGTLTFTASSTGAPGSITSGPLGTGTLTINGGILNPLTTTRTINNTLTIGGNFSTSGTQPLVLGGSVDLSAGNRTISVGTTTVMSGNISNGSLSKAGSGTLTINGTNTYSGQTTITSGILAVAGGSAISDSGAVAITGGTLRVDANETIGNLSGTSSGTIDLSGNTLTINQTGSTSYSGSITGTSAGRFVKAGAGTLTLGTTLSSPTFGGFQINQGTLSITDWETIGAPGSTVANFVTLNGGDLTITRTSAFFFDTPVGFSVNGTGSSITVSSPTGNPSIRGVVAGSGSFTKLGSGTLGLNATNTINGTVTVGAGTLALNNVNALGNATLDTGSLGSQTVTFGVSGTNTYNLGALSGADNLGIGANTISVGSNGANTTFSGNLTGTGALIKVGAGTLALTSADNSYSGGTTINGGTLQVDGPNRLGNATGSLTINNGTFRVSGGISSGRNIVLGNAASTILVDSSVTYNATAAAVVSGTGTLNKAGGGLLTLNGNNTYSGATVVQAGTLRFTSGNTSATAIQALGTNATVNLGVAATSSGILEYTGTGAATLAKNINALGNGNDAIVNSSASMLTLTGAISKNGTTLTLRGGAGGLSVNGSISGSAPASDLVVDGGTVNLNAANTYNGPTSLTGNATLNANAASAMGSTTVVTVGSGSNLVINVSGAVNDAAPVILSGGSISRGAGVSETFGALLLTADSTINFGSGATGTFNFGTYTAADWKLTVLNFAEGNVLTFKTDLTGTITNDSRFSFSNAFSSGWDSGSSTFTITAIPEPTVILPILAFIGLFLWGERKRIPNQIRKRLRKLGLARS